MQVSDILRNNSNSNSAKALKPIAIAIVDDNQVDYLLDENSDLYPPNYRAWHAKVIKQHGVDFWLRHASTARQEGRDKQRHFVWLINRAMRGNYVQAATSN